MSRLSFAPVSVEMALDLMHVMTLATRADGVVDPGERRLLDAAGRAVGLGSLPVPESRPAAFRPTRPEPERALLFAGAAWVMVADGRLAQAEQQQLGELGARLGLDAARIRGLWTMAQRAASSVSEQASGAELTVAFASLVQEVLGA
jgi:uncharacterized membrane protein YebE (DUF533 family)